MNNEQLTMNNGRLILFLFSLFSLFFIMSCSNPFWPKKKDDGGGITPPLPPSIITYTVAQVGGIDAHASTTGIEFTFSGPVSGLTAADIAIANGNGEAVKGTLAGGGTSWVLGITVTKPGLITVQITKDGIEDGIKNVALIFHDTIPAPTIDGITAVYTGTGVIYPSTPLNNLKDDLIVKAQYSDGYESTLSWNEYTLSGTLAVGVSNISVTYTYEGRNGIEHEITVFNVTVSSPVLTGITVVYDTTHPVYTTTPLDDLKAHLTVTAAYSDGSAAPVSAYTLIGDITTAGEKTITVSYTEDGVTETATFTVNVTLPPQHGISLSAVVFPDVVYGYAAQAAQTVTVTNVGTMATGSLTITIDDDAAFELSATTLAGIAVGGDSEFTVTPVIGLAVGAHTAIITVSDTANGISEELDISFTVNPVPTGTVTIVYYWLNEQTGVLVSTSDTTILSESAKDTLIITANNSSGYSDYQWFVNGIQQSETIGSFTFSAEGRLIGNYTVDLLVKKDGGFYNASFAVTVTD